MKKILVKIIKLLAIIGLDLRHAVLSLRGIPGFVRDWRQLRQQQSASAERFDLRPSFPCLADRFAQSGSAGGHYFHQDLLVARKVFLNNPAIHMDVGSRIDGLVAHIASFRPVTVIDIRPNVAGVHNIRFVQADMMARLDQSLVGSCDSLSSLHAIEHFGLGRYGDSIDFDGHLKGLENLYKLLKKSGKFYFSVPIGPQRIEFNAHRVFSVSYLLDCFDGKYSIDAFSYVDDSGNLHENAALDAVAVDRNFGCLYGCGIFEMTKL